MSGRQTRFTAAIILAVILLSVSGVALIVTCDYQRNLDFRAPLDDITRGMEQPDELMIAAVAQTRERVGFMGSLAGGPTDATYSCDADGCTLDRFWFTVAIEPLCPFGRDEDRRTVVVYEFDLGAGQVQATSVDAPWNGGIEWSQMPLTFERAAEVMRANVPADFIERHPEYSLHMSAAQTEWLVDLAAADGDGPELHVFKLNVADETVEPIGV